MGWENALNAVSTKINNTCSSRTTAVKDELENKIERYRDDTDKKIAEKIDSGLLVQSELLQDLCSTVTALSSRVSSLEKENEELKNNCHKAGDEFQIEVEKASDIAAKMLERINELETDMKRVKSNQHTILDDISRRQLVPDHQEGQIMQNLQELKNGMAKLLNKND